MPFDVGASKGGFISYRKSTKEVSINLIFVDLVNNGETIGSITWVTENITLPSETVSIRGYGYSEAGTLVATHLHINTDGNIQLWHSINEPLNNIYYNGSCYLY